MAYADLEKDKVERLYIDCMVQFAKDNCEMDCCKHMLAPIVICRCLRKNSRQDLDRSIQNLVDVMQLSSNEKTYIEEISLCILRDFIGNDEEYKEKKYKKTIRRLMDELN